MNNYWEDKDMSEKIKKFHDETIKNTNIPEWSRINCPFCTQKLSHRSVRNIQLCLNTKNYGDIAVEFCCDECSKMDTIYFKTGIRTIQEFCNQINSNTINVKHISEAEMYDMQYNNILTIMHNGDNNDNGKNISSQ
jgi:primosomal protein N'